MSSKNNATSTRSPIPWPAPRRLQRAGLHRIAWRDAGAPRGAPWLVLHGGPGSGCQPGLLAPFDLERQRVIAPDQRGAGASLPHGRTQGNTLQALVDDLEALRRHLGIARWSVLAGSWGTVLALAYAQQHPGRVERLVLRGAFALTRREVGPLLLPGPRARRTPADWRAAWPVAQGAALSQALSRLEQLLQSGTASVAARHVVRGWALRELRDAAHGLRRSLRHIPPQQGRQAAATRQAWAGLRRQQRRGAAHLHAPGTSRQEAAQWGKYRLQAHYLRRRGFVRPGTLDAAVRQLARSGVPVDWAHGQFDAICPPANSARWAALGRKAGGVARLARPASGHLAGEPAMRDCLRELVALG